MENLKELDVRSRIFFLQILTEFNIFREISKRLRKLMEC